MTWYIAIIAIINSEKQINNWEYKGECHYELISDGCCAVDRLITAVISKYLEWLISYKERKIVVGLVSVNNVMRF